MGAWGVGIFSNDDAADLREDFRDLIAEGHSPDEATRRLTEAYGIGTGDEANDFWLALAATQHRTGHVGTDIIDRALAIIDDLSELERWPKADRRRRAATLAKLRATLETEPRAPQRVRRRKKVDTALQAGQHVLVPVDGGERQMLLRVTGIQEDKGGRYPVVVVLDWDGSQSQLLAAHRLPSMLSPDKLRRADSDFGFVITGPSDPTDLQVLPAVSDTATPQRQWQSRFVITWALLGRFLDSQRRPRLWQPSRDGKA
ncbi:MAG: hypothetical protein GX344_09540 [Intrasporangiaceae bacterium]|nr:hypothetical protein [Intrasporangiaceae bacterium]